MRFETRKELKGRYKKREYGFNLISYTLMKIPKCLQYSKGGAFKYDYVELKGSVGIFGGGHHPCVH